MKALLIAEKPDLSRKIEAVYNKCRNQFPYLIDFQAQRGHLMTLKLPSEIDETMASWNWDHLPFYPQEHGGWQYKIIEEKKQGNFLTSKERYQKIKEALDSGEYDFVIHAGDPDQEGELLVRLVLEYAKNTLPVKRFWTNDLTDSHILHALQNLKDDDTDPMLTNLLSAAYARQHWDYIFGMNISEGASLQMKGRAACGRVKTVLQAIVVKREEEIANFVTSTCYGVKARYKEGFEGQLFSASNAASDEYADEDQKAGMIWFDTKKEAEDFISRLNKKAKVIKYDRKPVKTYAPKLFKLSSAQVTAGKQGFNDARTLQIIQSLYEKQILSYPRTDCEYLSSNEDFEKILHALYTVPIFKPFIRQITPDAIARVRKSKKWINDKALEESGHSALRPTTIAPDWNALTEEEKQIFTMIAKRFVAIFLPPIEQESIELITDIDENTFKTTGKVTLSRGFADIFDMKLNDIDVPPHKAGDILDVSSFYIPDKTTTCPRRFTSPDLIAVCENPAKYLNDQSLKKLGKQLKIGTPATRSGIIQQLVKRDHYLAEKKENKRIVLVPTDAGTEIIRNLGDLLICKVDMTGMWEERLTLLRAGAITSDDLDRQMKIDFERMLNEIRLKPMKSLSEVKNPLMEEKCPKCGRPMRKMDWGWSCSGYQKDSEDSCSFSIGYSAFGGRLTDKDIKTILKGNKTSPKKFKSKTSGKTYNGILFLDGNGDLKMEFAQSRTMLCPLCGRPAYFTKNGGVVCKGFFDKSCTFGLYPEVAHKKLTPDQLAKLVEEGKLGPLSGFKNQKGDPFKASLSLDSEGRIKLTYVS